MEPTKVQAATVTIAGVEINGYQLPDGSYRCNPTQVITALGIESKQSTKLFQRSDVLQKLTKTTVKARQGKRSDVLQNVYLCRLEDINVLLGYLAGNGNKVALAILVASATETWQRRFDKAFKVERTEHSYEETLADLFKRLRQEVRVNYRPCFTDWLKKDGEASGLKVNYGAHVVALKRAIGLDAYTKVDDMTYDQLRLWDVAETRYDAYRISGMNHKQAMKTLEVNRR